MKKRNTLLSFSLASLLLITLVNSPVSANEYTVQSDYLEVFTGAGRGYPIFFVVEKGETFDLLKSKTDWLKIKSQQGHVGWVNYLDYASAISAAKHSMKKQVAKADWEVGMSAGSFGPDKSFSASIGYYIKPTVAIQAELKKVIGAFSHSNIASGQFMFQGFRKYIVYPYMAVGVGRMDNIPRQTLVNAEKSQGNIYHFGGGLNYIPYKRLNLRLSVKNYYLEKTSKSYLDIRLGLYALFG